MRYLCGAKSESEIIMKHFNLLLIVFGWTVCVNAETIASPLSPACSIVNKTRKAETKGLKVLYIGDSITDGNWGGGGKPSSARNLWDMNHIFGSGYMYLCAAHYMGNYPEREYQFFNRGISGNTLDDLENRWETDVLNLQPDVLSILVGTNDVDQHQKKEGTKPFDFEAWEKKYRSLLDRSLKANSGLKLVIAAPFVANTGSMRKTTDYQQRDSLVRQCARIVKKIAHDYKAVYLPYGELFDSILQKESSSSDMYWLWDGVHPTAAGHKRMADMWIERVDKKHIL